MLHMCISHLCLPVDVVVVETYRSRNEVKLEVSKGEIIITYKTKQNTKQCVL